MTTSIESEVTTAAAAAAAATAVVEDDRLEADCLAAGGRSEVKPNAGPTAGPEDQDPNPEVGGAQEDAAAAADIVVFYKNERQRAKETQNEVA